MLAAAASWCVIQAMPTGESAGCRPPVTGHADHLFRWHGVRFFGDTGISGRLGLDSVDGMVRNPWEHSLCPHSWTIVTRLPVAFPDRCDDTDKQVVAAGFEVLGKPFKAEPSHSEIF